jgi:hypothetical protein
MYSLGGLKNIIKTFLYYIDFSDIDNLDIDENITYQGILDKFKKENSIS